MIDQNPVPFVPDAKVGVLLVNFGEPVHPTIGAVESFLERIFLQNASLEDLPSGAAVERSHQLAKSRAPALVKVYEAIGGSPLNAQADQQAGVLQTALRGMGWDVNVYSAFQFTEPTIGEQLRLAREDGVVVLLGVPVYPLCGHSTTISAISAIRSEMERLSWFPVFACVTGWHSLEAYANFRASHVREFVARVGLDLNHPGTRLYFSVHGTPIKSLTEGNRYDRYVDEHSRVLAVKLGAKDYVVGFQNHAGRGIPWTQPDNKQALRSTDARDLVVVPISFMHEQSETLAEIDIDLKAEAAILGKRIHRVPVPHDDPRFTLVLREIVCELATANSTPPAFTRCRCSPIVNAWCTNGDRELPRSPFGPDDSVI